jgi:signal transduction histidine kinase
VATVNPALTPEVRSGLGAFGRTARALVSAVTLPELARGALEELRDALGLELAALYLPAGDGTPALERLEIAGSGREARDRLVFDAEAWRLAVQGDAPLLMHDRGEWLMQHPFTPPAASWLVLPLGDRLGVVIAAPATVGPESGAVLRLLGDLLGAGIASARLRQELEHTALERERLRLAAEVHDGLAQDLALAMRELALLDSAPAPDVAEASRARLRAAIASAHGTVRSRLRGMVAPSPLGGLRPALEDLCERFTHRGLSVRLDCDGQLPELPPPVAAAAIRVVSEALANAERHASADGAVLQVHRRGERVELVVEDDGRGFASAAGPGHGHFGLLLMRERARAAGGSLTVDSVPGRGTRVALDLPLSRS